MKNLKTFLPIFVIILANILLHVSTPVFQDDLWWDASVYIGMGKHMFSAGESGLWEPARPIIWPAILGVFWKLGFDPVVAGKIVSLIISSAILLLTYLIANQILKNNSAALFTVILLGFFPTFFLFESKVLTTIPSTFFLLLSVYFLIKSKYEFAGLFAGIAFTTRFFQIFAILGIVAYLAYKFYKKQAKKQQIIKFFSWFSVPIALYLILNLIFYKNPIKPFLDQIFLTLNTGQIYSQSFLFYAQNFAQHNIIFFIAIVIGIYFLFQKKEKSMHVVGLIALFAIVPYQLIAHKEMRFLIPALPFLTILAAYGITQLVQKTKQAYKFTLFAASILSVILLFSSIPTTPFEDNMTAIQTYDMKNQNIWTSNPKFLLETNEKASELVYYPVYNSNKIDKLRANLQEPNLILLDSCNMICPEDDKQCSKKHQLFLQNIESDFIEVLSVSDDNCNYRIYST